MNATYKRTKDLFYWKNMRKSVREFIRKCDVCQRSKAILETPAGLLQPLPIHHAVGRDISLDFVEGLPVSHGKCNFGGG